MAKLKSVFPQQLKKLILVLFILGFIYDVVLPLPVSDLSLLIIIALLVGSVIMWNIDGMVLIKHSVWLAILCSIFAILEYNRISERLAIWWYIFFTVGALHLTVTYRLKPGKKYLDSKQLIQEILRSYSPIIKLKLSAVKLAHLTIPVITFTLEEVKITNLVPAILNLTKTCSVFLSLYLVYSLVSNTLSTIEVYQSFYPSNSLNYFIQQTGQYAAISLLIGIVIGLGLFFVIKNRRTLAFIVTPALLFSLFLITNYVYVHTTQFQYDIRLWSVSPKKATLWDEIKLSGRNFRDLPFKGKVYIDGVEHAITSWTDKQIVIQADPTKTSSGEIKVIDYYGKESVNTLPIEYYDFETKELIE
ncbi:IPT/TIG domain-containing protein [Candidatus Chazhemtobacterium aquaticus]|uniref:IPT/TIG domain-containing protein n=1 Tax=Candidatus Chazhemtobacterium aquaticus TaxID=2715735 RepID=A0A857NDI2_9BACT|nr:IPT/TIG domain-containing protein [Candidatus Chazhemtobacterium aquaticus]QHO63501.1 hypothetical protein MICH65_0520 [Candidatus Chazhemtobacterium aquaticus]